MEENPSGGQLADLWPGMVENLAPTQRAWLATSKPVMLAENTAVIAVANDFTRTQLEGRLRTRLEDELSDRLGMQIRIVVTVDDSLRRPVHRRTGRTTASGRAGPPAGPGRTQSPPTDPTRHAGHAAGNRRPATPGRAPATAGARSASRRPTTASRPHQH